jgi:hypothetical protein
MKISMSKGFLGFASFGFWWTAFAVLLGSSMFYAGTDYHPDILKLLLGAAVLFFVLLLWITRGLFKEERVIGQSEGRGQSKSAKGLFKDFDSVCILRCYSTGWCHRCLVEIRDEILYVDFLREENRLQVREGRIYRVRYNDQGELRLENDHDRIIATGRE